MLFRSLAKANLAPLSRNFAAEKAAAKKVRILVDTKH
jgi:hypothetical protein